MNTWKNLLIVRTTECWERLPGKVVQSPSLKTHLDAHLYDLRREPALATGWT